MRKRLIIWIILLIALSGNTVFAQKQWTLNQCISYAIQNNLDIKRCNIQSKISKENYNQSIRDLLPGVSMSTGSNINFGRSVDPSTNDYVDMQFFSTRYSIGASIDLFRGFTKLNTIKFSHLNYLAGLEDEQQQKNDIAFKVMNSYFDVLFFEGLVDIVVEQKKYSELNLKRTQLMVKNGLQAEIDILQMKSSMAVEELSLVRARNSYQTALLSLKQAMNFENGEEFELENLLVINIARSDLPGSSDSIYAVAMGHYPRIKAQEIRKQAARKSLSITRGWLLPSLRMSAGHGSNYSMLKGAENTTAFREQLKNKASQNVGLSLNIPVFGGLKSRSNVKKAKLNLIQAENSFEIVSQQLYNTIEKDYQDLTAFLVEYGQTVIQHEASELAYRAAEKKLEQGLIDVVVFYNTKNQMARAKSNVLRTMLQYEIKKRTIDFFMGLPIYSEVN